MKNAMIRKSDAYHKKIHPTIRTSRWSKNDEELASDDPKLFDYCIKTSFLIKFFFNEMQDDVAYIESSVKLLEGTHRFAIQCRASAIQNRFIE